jgi:transposase InsO family protein
MGKVKITQTLARAGLHLGATTVRRMLTQPPGRRPAPQTPPSADKPQRVVTAKYPNHVWHADLTTLPIGGFWCPWLPLDLPQCWPFCWWLAIVVDHHSRRVMGFAVFVRQPTLCDVRAFLERTFAEQGVRPKYLITGQGPQFHPKTHRPWCKRHGIKPRFGAIGQHGSIAVIERAILTLKLLLHGFTLIPLRHRDMCNAISAIIEWHNEYRPHTTLRGRTPNEVYHGRFPACRKPRFEPRDRWPRGSPCARPWALVRGKPGVPVELQVDYHAGQKHLPIVRLNRAA